MRFLAKRNLERPGRDVGGHGGGELRVPVHSVSVYPSRAAALVLWGDALEHATSRLQEPSHRFSNEKEPEAMQNAESMLDRTILNWTTPFDMSFFSHTCRVVKE